MIVEVYYLDRVGSDYQRPSCCPSRQRLECRKFDDLEIAKSFAKNLNQQFYKEPYVRIVRGSEVSIIRY